MPRGDKTGPNGQGPMTGRRMGYCVNNNPAFFGRTGMGRGMRFGFGRGFNSGQGRGLGRRFAYSENTNYSQKELIKNELEELKTQMEFLESELKKLD